MNLAVLQFVSPQQTGFVQHSFIAENLMLLKLLQTKIEEEDEEAIYLFLDMEKAYDRCSWAQRMLYESSSSALRMLSGMMRE